jgi:energy-coupling factor transporter ATP-binding protein EcfA2
VAIIGARGSGKTALADVIAAGCDAITPIAWKANEHISPSFLVRARKLLGNASATLAWAGGATVTRFLDGRDANGHLAFPRARYLSQQFVEELCSSAGVSDGLIAEIERVIFEAHPQDARDGAIDCAELREFRTSRFQQAREREADAIADISERIATEIEKEASIAGLSLQVTQKDGQIKSYTQDLAKLVVKGTEAQAARHAQLGQAVQALRGTIQSYANQRRTFVALQDEVASTRATKAPELLRQAKERHQHSGLDAKQWDEFLLIYKGNVDTSLADYVTWADQQIATLTVAEENLFDRRKAGPFQGRGSLIALADATLRPAWETGSAADVQTAMAGFIVQYMRDLIGHAPYAQNQQADFRAWLKKFAHWLFATDHISVRYEIVYDSIDIRKLSPGTRGIVLLLLYPALDNGDDRPLIIDQPEENLDPKSVFEELVALFIAAKAKRQVIMVTHNANLVINADQIIVADAGPHAAGGLPPITYKAGGMENADIRKAVCDILEGGEEAFRERARRLRVRLDR